MAEEQEAMPPDCGQSHGLRNIAAKGFDALTSVKFALLVVVLLTVACIAGTFLPQDSDVAKYLALHPSAEGRMAVLTKLGLTHVFEAQWFIGLLCLLAISLVACNTRRFVAGFRATGRLRGRAVASMVMHASILLILAGGVIRGVWGQKGQLEFRKGETVDYFMTNRGRIPLPFALRLENFEVETYTRQELSGGKKEDQESIFGQLLVAWPDKNLKLIFPAIPDVERIVAPGNDVPTAETQYKVKVVRYEPDFALDAATRQVTSRSDAPDNPAILVAVVSPGQTNEYWLFAKHPDFNTRPGGRHGEAEDPIRLFYRRVDGGMRSGMIKSFRSTVAILEDGRLVEKRQIEVNAPMAYKRHNFYQSNYRAEDLDWTGLQVVRDPGVPVVYIGFVLLIVGLFAVFYLHGRNGAGATKEVQTP